MYIKQLSVFVENKKGRLAEITEILAHRGVDIRALSIADTTDYGILRLIVDDAEKAEKALKAENITVSITKVIGISVSDVPGAFSQALRCLEDGDVEIEYAYAFITSRPGKAYVILRVNDREKAIDLLKNSNAEIITQKEIFD